MNSALRVYVTSGVALVGTSLVAVTPVAPPPCGAQARGVQLTTGETVPFEMFGETIAYEMGGSGVPIIPASGLANANEVYVQPNYPGAIPHALGYPAELFPFQFMAGMLDGSMNQGQQIMNNALMTQLGEGHNVVFYGTSQSASIQTIEMEYLASLPADEQPSPDRLAFVDYGDPDVPNGGMLARFDYPGVPATAPYDFPGNVTLPSLGITFLGPTPADTPYHNVIYTGEYDGFADFPRYPADILADLNALWGTIYVHAGGSFKPASFIDAGFIWPTSPGYDGNTTYILVPVHNLPLLDPLRANPLTNAPDPLGNAIADLLQPDLKVLVNLGYGPDNMGYSEYPNVFTPASGLFPDVNPGTVLNELITGADEGVRNFVADLKTISPSSIVATMTNASPTTAVAPLDLNPSNFTTELEHVVVVNNNVLADLISFPVTNISPVVSLLTAIGVSVPALNGNLVLSGFNELENGNLSGALDYFTDPFGANIGLGSIAAWADFSQGLTTVGELYPVLESAATFDAEFIEGLPHLLSSLLP